MQAEAQLSEAQQKRVWEGMLGAEIRANYFADLWSLYLNKQRLATWAAVLFSSGAVVSVVVDLGPGFSWIRFVLTLASAGINAYLVVVQNQKFAVDASDLHSRWNRLAKEYEALWENVYADNAQERLRELDEETTQLSKAGSGFRYDEHRMLRWEEHVLRHRLANA